MVRKRVREEAVMVECSSCHRNEVSGAPLRSARVPAGGIRILDRVTSLDETCTLSLHS